MQILNPFVLIFISKNDMQEKKLSLVSGTNRNFQLEADYFCSTSAEPWYCVNSPPQDWKIPSALVTSERFLY